MIVVLTLVVFPVFVALAYFASLNLLPLASDFVLNLPPANLSESEGSFHLLEPNATSPLVTNMSPGGGVWLTLAEVLLLVAAAAVLAIAIMRRLRRRAAGPFSEEDEVSVEEGRERVAAILDETAESLASGSDYRATVLRCYKLVEQALESRSEVDGKPLTAREFRKIVSEKLDLESPYLTTVIGLFEVAKYSELEVTREQAQEAAACLSSLSALLRRMKPMSQV